MAPPGAASSHQPSDPRYAGGENMMRAKVLFLALSASLATVSMAQAQRVLGPMPSDPTPMSAPTLPGSTAAAPAPAATRIPDPSCKNPNALGITRTVEIDTTGGPGFGFEHFKMYDFLKPGEVVLTFDDGPWPKTTETVLEALAEQCVKAIFFSIGRNAIDYPDILKKVATAGHTIGSHTWTHQDLSKTRGSMPIGGGKREVRDYEPKDEIEKGISAIKIAIAETGKEAAFIRPPYLKQPPEIMAYFGSRNLAVFSTDFDSFDFKFRKPEAVVNNFMEKLKRHGKGIALMHDVHPWTANAVKDILAQLKAGGYKIVHMKSKEPVQSLPEYDAMVLKEMSPLAANARPMSSVIKTISE
jgi:peptidoglycan/xylan/chitin deacetylase (PgdA/CDA1 family)